MAEAKAEVGSPRWWLCRLEKELRERQAHMQLMDDYYSGRHPLPFVTKAHNAKMRDEFRGLLEDSKSNFMGLVVDATEERLRVDGFRLSGEKDPKADDESWRIWQQNQMDAETQIAFVEALTKRVSYLSIWSGKEHPIIAVEDPLQTIVGYVPGTNLRVRAAALKLWRDDWTGKVRANVYLPDAIHKFERQDREGSALVLPASVDDPGVTWVELDKEMVENPLGVVPIIPLRNRPKLRLEGESEIVGPAPTQDRINGTLFLRCLAGYFGAHRQRWAVGLTMHEDENGKPEEPFDVAVDKLWHSEDGGVKFGEFGQTDLTGYIKAIEQDILHVAITTRTPRHYLIEQGQSPSGDAIRSAESGLIKKVGRKSRTFGEGLEEAIRLAHRFAGNEAPPADSEVVWADAEIRSEAEITDAVIKQYQQGLIPWEAAMEKLGYTQTEIRRFAGMRAEEQLTALLNPPETPEDEGEGGGEVDGAA